eukprot:10516772-Alexandrium_andersonii.AAC.1
MARMKIRARVRWNELDTSDGLRFQIHELEAITAMADDVTRHAPQETNGVYYADKVKAVHVRAIKSLPSAALAEYEDFL